MLKLLLNYIHEYCDAPRPWGLYFQDSAAPQMEGLVELHDNIMFYLIIILFGVGWIITSVIRNYAMSRSPISHKYLNHGTLIELVWTITPALILILIAFPSFKLLYLMDEVSDPAMSVLAEGHQWYWSYQYSDFLNDDNESIEFDSYMIPEEDLEDGGLRMLEVDNRVILPELTHVRLVITAADVIHSFAVPSLGIKADAYPGRLNQVSVLINREGVYYGQCSEICGVLHSSMPIVIESVSLEKFLSWLDAQASLFLLSRQHVSSFKRAYSTNSRTLTLSTLHPLFVTGFCDGEACFHISLIKNNELKVGWRAQAELIIVLHQKDLDLLELIQSYFSGVGSITKQRKDSVQYRVRSVKDLRVIMDHFDKYPLITQKWADYQLFKRVVDLMNRKEHLTPKRCFLQEIVNIRASMNQGGCQIRS